MSRRVFLSYSHEDSSKVKIFAMFMSVYGFDVWIDEKNISSGNYYTTDILSGIHDSELYLVFLSHASLNSEWVGAEIDFAMHEKIKNKLEIIPVLLEDIDVPVCLSNVDYLDARLSLKRAALELSNKYKNNIKRDNNTLASISFSISETTIVEIGPWNSGVTPEDLIDDRDRILADLRKRAYGILMNFVPAYEFDFRSDKPKFTNGVYEESVTKIAGTFDGGIREKITVEAVVFNPSLKTVMQMMKDRLEVLGVSAITFGILIPIDENRTMIDIQKKCLKKIQEEYIIISYDPIEGARIEVSNDLYVSVQFSDEQVKVRLSSKYNWDFVEKVRSFSVFDFIGRLLN